MHNIFIVRYCSYEYYNQSFESVKIVVIVPFIRIMIGS